ALVFFEMANRAIFQGMQERVRDVPVQAGNRAFPAGAGLGGPERGRLLLPGVVPPPAATGGRRQGPAVLATPPLCRPEATGPPARPACRHRILAPPRLYRRRRSAANRLARQNFHSGGLHRCLIAYPPYFTP